jgi:hypothetical protein
MALQVLGLTQSLLDPHVVRHAFAPHTNGVQDDCVPGWQAPAPLHWGADVNVDPVHVAAPHVVPAAYSRQAPAPSHVPSVPQVAAPWSAHWLRGSCPAATSVHVPMAPAMAHDRHVPVHELVQQTPCWHRPDWHSVPAPHVTPGSFFEHTPLLQTLPAAQWASVVQVMRHVPFVSQA